MADSEAKQLTETAQDQEKKLKYLDFVQVTAVYLIVCFSSVYEYAKENAGPLRPGVQAVERTVKTVIGPVYKKFHDIPVELLEFVDHKVDELIKEVDCHVPSLVKQASSLARSAVSEMKQSGVVNTATHLAQTVYSNCEPTAKELYSRYEPIALHYAVASWRSLNRLPLFPQVASVVVPTGVYWAEKYNQTVCYTAGKGYPAASYMPVVPIEKIGKIFQEAEHGNGVATNGEYVPVAK